MGKVILVHAQCVNPEAKGDAAFAGSIAADLVRELRQEHTAIAVFLVSPLAGLVSFHRLYGQAINGFVSVQGEQVGLSSLEDFDAVEHQVIAFIDANRCKHPSSELLKRVLHPQTKVLVVGNMNQPSNVSAAKQNLYHQKLAFEQPGVYGFFDPADLLIASAGLSPERLGIPTIKSTDELPPLTPQEELLVPKGEYGFMYLYHSDRQAYDIAVQFISLTNFANYVLVGNFANNSYIQDAYNADNYRSRKKQLNISFIPSLASALMRKAMVNSKGPLVATTGVMSTLEAMRDNKLPFYQDLTTNERFVSAYIIALRSLCSSEGQLAEPMLGFVIELSNLLFAPKPLPTLEMCRAQALLRRAPVITNLLAANQRVLAQANGKIAPRLLSFLAQPRVTHDQTQVTEVCHALRISGEKTTPNTLVALRRAVAKGLLFETKVLLQSMSAEEINCVRNPLRRTTLHFAVHSNQLDCVRALVAAGAAIDVADKDGKTPLHFAFQTNNQKLIDFLLNAGASVEEENVDDRQLSGTKRRYRPY